MSTIRGGPGLPGITGDEGKRLVTGVRRRAGTGRAPGSALIAVAAWLLALTGGGALFVSFSAQYAYIFKVRRQDAASVIEALLLDLLMIVFTLLALGLSRAGKSSRTEPVLIVACAAAGRRPAGSAGGAAAGHCPQLPVRRAERQPIMTTVPPAEPLPPCAARSAPSTPGSTRPGSGPT
jgi:hypothetical protein